MGKLKKYYITLLLLLCVTFSLSAESKIYVFFPSITGAGQTPDDNRLLVNMITNELAMKQYTLINTPRGADFLLYGIIGLYDDKKDYTNEGQPTITYTYNASLQTFTYEQPYIFQLVLRKVATGDVILQNVVYVTMDDMRNFLPVLVNNLFMYIGSIDTGLTWADYWLSLGASAFWSPRTYMGTQEAVHYANFGGGFSAETHLFRYVSFEAGAEITQDWVPYTNADEDQYQNLMLEFPLAIKFNYKFTNYFMMGLLGGAQINVPLLKNTEPPRAAWMIGLLGGVRVGSGMLYLEPRFSKDIGSSELSLNYGATKIKYQRNIVHIGIGYKHGFFRK